MPTVTQTHLAELSARRRQVLSILTGEKKRGEPYQDKLPLRQTKALRQAIEKPIAECAEAITALIAADAKLSVPAELPEPGTLSDGSAAALAGRGLLPP